MSVPGRKPDPASVKEAKGNPSRRPIGSDPKTQSVVTSSSVQPPTWLKGDGLRVWKRIAPRLVGIKILTPVDADTFARYCQNFGRWLKMQKDIKENGEYYGTSTGYARPHPAMMIVLRIEPLLERAEDRFGLNPAERQRLFAQRAVGGAPDLLTPVEASKLDEKKPPTQDLENASPVGMLN